MKKVITALLVILSLPGVCQEEKEADAASVKRTNISLQVGFPYLTGGNLEFLIPRASNRVSFTADFGYLPINIAETNTTLKYWGAGTNFYFLPKGKGPYLGLDYGRLPISTNRIEEEIVDYNATFQSFNSKLGIKAGKSVFVRLEFGYSIVLYDLEAANDYLYKTYGIRITPTIDFLQFLNGRFGVGFAF